MSAKLHRKFLRIIKGQECPYCIIAVFTLILVCITKKIWGCYYESYQAVFDYAIGGVFTYGLYTPDLITFFWNGSRRIFNFLYNINHSIAWVYFAQLTVLFSSVWFLFQCFLRFVLPDIKIRYTLIILTTIFFGFIYDSFVLHQITRVAGWAVIAGMFPLLISVRSIENTATKKYMVTGILLFTTGCWIRFDSSMGAFFIILIFYFLYGGKMKNTIPYLFVLSAFLCLFFYHYFDSESYYKFFLHKVELNLFNRKAVVPLSQLTTLQDSVKYMAVTHKILADSVSFTPAFYKKILTVQQVHVLDISVFKNAVQVFTTKVLSKPGLFLQDFLLLLMIFFSVTHIRQFLKPMLAYIIYLSILFGVSYLMKMEERFLYMAHGAFFLSLFFLHAPQILKNPPRFLFLLSIIIMPWIHILTTHNDIRGAMQMQTSQNNAYKYLARHHSGKTIVISSEITPLIKPSEIADYSIFKKMYFYNYSMFSLSPAYRPFLEKECNCNVADFVSFYDFLYKRKSEVIIIDHSTRIDVLENYLKTVYKRDYKFKVIDSLNYTFQSDFHDEKVKVFAFKDE